MKKEILAALASAALIFGSTAYADGEWTCGLKPLPNMGCRIGMCVNGAWQQICDSAPTMTCGLPPLPSIGCRIGACVDGHWEQICDSNPTMSCGPKPLPNPRCRLGRCLGGGLGGNC